MELKSRLSRYYQTRFPIRIDVTALQPLADGPAGAVYRVHLTAHLDGGQSEAETRILKLYAPGTDGKDGALKERHALHSLHNVGYPVPRPTLVEVDQTYLGKPFVIMEDIPGGTLWDAFTDGTAGAEQREELVNLFAGLLASLHSMGPAVMVKGALIKDEYTLVKREIHTLRTAVERFERPEFAPIADWLHARRDTVPCPDPCITHRNYSPWNVLMAGSPDRPHPAYVIDWAWQLGDPRYDVAWMVTMLQREGHTAFAREALASYQAQTGQTLEEMSFFEVLTSANWLLLATQPLKAARSGARQRVLERIAPPARHTVAALEASTGVSLYPVTALLAP